MFYFAYGSNLHPARIGERLGPVEFVDTLELGGFHVQCNKRGLDGSAKANLTASSDARAYGAIYRVPDPAWPRLDDFEGPGYRRIDLRELCDGDLPGPIQTYVARSDWLTETLRPYDWYRDLLVWGARHHGFPAEYIEGLGAIEASNDPDTKRKLRQLRLLATIRRQ